MKLLILTSEFLNPSNTLGSTFELSQAQILSKQYNVSIISVRASESLSARVKAFLKSAFRFKGTGKAVKELFEAINYLFLAKKIVYKYNIEGIEVFEGIGYAYISSDNFKNSLKNWVRAGLNAYNLYKKEKGLPDLIHAHGRFLNAGALALAIKQADHIKYIYTEHSTFYRRRIAPLAAKPYLDAIIKNASTLITVSESLLEDVENFLDRRAENALIIPNALDKIFEYPEKRPWHDKTKEIVFTNIASLDEKKGLDILIKAFASAFKGDVGYKLYICGDGPLMNMLADLRDSLGLTRQIVLTGKKTKLEIRDQLDQSHIFVLSSRVETFGVVVMEALSRGCPVIATRCGGPEYLVNETNGVLVEVENVTELAQALKNMANHYSKYNSDLIRQQALDQYGSNSFLNTMSKLYKSVLS
jgi:glycosyltransferase involved in cell wall biosynthesis